jgi:hypothetical protein
MGLIYWTAARFNFSPPKVKPAVNRCGFRRQAAFFHFWRFEALCRDAVTVDEMQIICSLFRSV